MATNGLSPKDIKRIISEAISGYTRKRPPKMSKRRQKWVEATRKKDPLELRLKDIWASDLDPPVGPE